MVSNSHSRWRWSRCCWLWHRAEPEGAPEADLKSWPGLSAWAFSAATVVAAWAALQHAGLEVGWTVGLLAVVGLGLVNLARTCHCERLAPCAALLAASGLAPALLHTPLSQFPSLALALIALAGLPAADHLPPWHRAVTAVILRATDFLAVCHFWWKFPPSYAGDGIALTGLSFIRKKPLVLEVWGFLGVSSLWLLGQSLAGPAAALACATAGLWATQMLVWRHDWSATAVLWTLLGFAAVSAGLWQRLRAMRQAGFLLLGMALIKIFAVDVWDFTAFMRVVSFIVLGAALILLGLFYNKFASVLKRLLEESGDGGERP